MNIRKNKTLKNIVALTLALLLTLGQVLPVLPLQTVQAAQPVLTITGTGLEQDVLIYEEDWDNYDMVERYYSSNNNFNYHKIWKAKGYDIFDLIGEGNLKTDQDYDVAFVSAKDGGRVTKTVSELQSLYYHPEFTESSAVLVAPMLSFYRTAVFEPDYQILPDPAEVIWEDRDLTEADLDLDAPRLMTGQSLGEVSQNNQSFFNKQVGRIVVGAERPVEPPDDDFTDSPYKHITHEGPPYNIDTLTGATMTVEGPGVHSYRALSLRQIEETPAAGLYRGIYLENIEGQEIDNTFEGIKISYILDNFITLRENAGKVIFKNYLRQPIAEYTLEEIRDESRMLIAAYGVNEVPFVYTNLDMGYLPDKHNDGGCFKLVSHPPDGAAPAFTNVAYIYVEEDERPGCEHSRPPYDDPDLTQYIFTLSGSGLGKEVNYTTADLEAMTDLHLEKEYSLSNSEYYWYYNTYKGVPLWDLLLKAGMDPDIDDNTPVHFIAADYYNISPLTVGDIRNHDRWGYYEKNPADLGDGTFDGSGEDPLETGYPVLVAYGYNGYPYVKNSEDPGFNSGLGNRGGPLRIIFGKKDYEHTNGSHQVKYALRVIVGNDLHYTTHSYDPYDALAGEILTITVVDEDGTTTIKEEELTVGQLEDLIYGESVPAATADHVRAKGFYFTHVAGGSKISDLYEGVDLNCLLFEKIGLPGTMGTVTFTSSAAGQEPLVVNLADIVRTDYYNEVTGVRGLKPVLAFAKNGYPLVEVQEAESGYIGKPVVNRYGPLMALFGQTDLDEPGQWLRTVSAITVNMSTDPYAHLQPPYDQYADDELSISGDGVRKAHTVTVGELEFMQNYIFTGEYCLAKSETSQETAHFRGIDIYEFLRREVGFTAGADKIKFIASDDYEMTFDLEEIAKSDYINEISGDSDLKVMLAFGKNETPLVPSKQSEGYKETVGNHGGPLYLIIGQTEAGDLNSGKLVKSVSEIVVDAVAGDSWKHDFGVYTQYLDLPMLRVTGSQVAEPRTFTLRQIEALDEHIIRDLYMSETEVEGIIVWNLIKDVVGLAEGVTTPSSIRVFSGANYNQLQNTSHIMNGVLNSLGLTKEIILGYAIKGYPLVPSSSSPGYVNNNQYGPLRLIVEENNSMWTKNVDCIVVGTGDYEEPRMEDIPAGPAVFTVSGDGVPDGSKSYTLEELEALGETSGSYSYTSGGQLITEGATGVLLKDLLADLGISNPAWELEVTTTDNYPQTATLQEAIDEQYLVAYLADGEPFEDTKDGFDSSTIRIYRNYNDGSNWRNRLTLVNGVVVTSTDLPAVFTVSGDGVPGGSKSYTLDELEALGETSGSYSYTSGGQLITEGATGVLLKDLLADLGISNPAWELEVTTTDNYPQTATLQEAIDEQYLVAYLADGGPFEDTKDGFDSSTIRIYRNYNDGSNWRNRLTLVNGVVVTSTDLELPWSAFYRNDDGSSLPYASVRCITPDQKGGLWVGTNGGGAAYRDAAGNWTVYNSSNSPFVHNTIYGIVVDDMDGVWFVGGSAVTGLGAVYKQGDNWTVYTSENSDLPADYALTVVLDDEGGVWFGTAAGLAHRDRNKVWRIYDKSDGFPAASVTQIAFDDKGGAWVGFHPDVMGGQAGYAYLDASGQVTAHTVAAGEPGPWIRSFAFDADGGLWVTRYGHVDHIAADGTKTIYADKELVPFLAENEVIREIRADGEGNLWISLYPGGLLRRDAEGRLSTVTSWPNPLFSSVWYILPCSSGALYTGGNGGVTVLAPPGPASSNADLKDLFSSTGTLMPAFDPVITEYQILITDEAAGVPLIGAAVADRGRAARVISNAASFTEKAKVTVTAENGTKKTYTIGFLREIQLPAPGTADNPAQAVVDVGDITDLYLSLSAMDADKYALTMVVPAGAVTPTLKFNTVEADGGRQAVLPDLCLKCNLFIGGVWKLVEVNIPAGTTVTGPADWDGVLYFPEVTEKPTVSVDGTIGAVIEIGLLQGELFFDRAVRLFFPGEAGKSVGFVRDGVFTEITRILAKDNQDYADEQLPWGSEGKIDVGSDLVVWTKHFTQFVTYSPAPYKPGLDPKPGDEKEPPGKGELPRTRGTWYPAVLHMAAWLLCAGGLFFFKRRKIA